MLTNPEKAAEMIRRDVGVMHQQRNELLQQRQQIDRQVASLEAAITEWSSVLSNDPETVNG